MSDSNIILEVEPPAQETEAQTGIDEVPPAAVEVVETVPTSNSASSLDELAERIRQNHQILTERVFAIGRDLTTAKDKVVHGGFGDWVRMQFPTWGASTAARYMRAFEVWGPKEELVGCLEATGIYLLTAKATPKELRTEIEGELKAGQRPSLRKIRERVETARAAAKAAKAESNGGEVKTKAQRAAEFILSVTKGQEVRLRELLQGVNASELVQMLKQEPAEMDRPEPVSLDAAQT